MGTTTNQKIKEPVLRSVGAGTDKLRVCAVHITVVGAMNETYEMWPNEIRETHVLGNNAD